MFSPRKSLGRTHRRTLADTRTCTHACIHACNGIVPQKGSFIQVQHAVMRQGGERETMERDEQCQEMPKEEIRTGKLYEGNGIWRDKEGGKESIEGQQ